MKKSLYDQAVQLCEDIKGVKTVLTFRAIVVSYSPEVTKVKVEFITPTGLPVLHIEYWGNAEIDWVEKNMKVNAKSIKEAL